VANNPILNPQEQDLNLKVALRPDEITMRFVTSRLVNGEYLCFYNITIHPSTTRRPPNFVLVSKNIDQLSYKKAIEESIPVQDRKFIKLKAIDSFGAVLRFDVKEWITAAFYSVYPKVEKIGMKKMYKARVLPPRVMAYDVFMKCWQEFICKEFSKWIVQNGKQDSLIEKLIPEVLRKKLKKNINDLFDFNYDTSNNYMVVTLKPVWVMSFMYAAAKLGEKKPDAVNKSDIDKNKGFFNNVDNELKSFDENKWKDFLKKKNLFGNLK
jgi:hypothetical protein